MDKYNYKKPTELVRLLTEIIEEKDNSKIQELYLNIAVETLNTEFKQLKSSPFIDLILKKYIQLAMKEYVYSLRSKESEKELKELIDIIKDFEIL